MKKALITLLSFFILTSAKPQTKRAVIVAIGNYPEEGHWAHINSLNDTLYIKSALIKQGFAEENIRLVTDENATVAGITGALTDLIKMSKAGDIAVIHFSSHGEQIEDDNGDEADGLDETIVTYNAVYEARSGNFKKEQADYFRDDQFGILIDQLRSKLGKNGDVVVFMDLCHSGTGTRGNMAVRGDKPPMVSRSFDAKKFAANDSTSRFKEAPVSRGREETMATYVVISAARAEELDEEMLDENSNRHIGPLSFAIGKVFENLDSGATYRSLFSNIGNVMNEKVPGQHPVLEGNGINRKLFGGKIIYQKPFVEISALSGNEITLKAGLFAGLDTGAKVAVYKSGTADPSRSIPLATGKVTNATSYSSTVLLEAAAPPELSVSGWVFVTAPVYNIKPINVRIASKKNYGPKAYAETEISAIQNGLTDLPLVNFSGEPELIIAKGAENDSLKIVSKGFLFKLIKNIPGNIQTLKEALQRYAQYKLLRDMEIKDPQINVAVQLVPVLNGQADTTRIDTKMVSGIYEYTEGDTMALLVTNPGTQPVYFNVLDVQPDGQINPVLPNAKFSITANSLRIPAGGSHLFAEYKIIVGPPFGMEVFKVFASADLIDLESITLGTSRGSLSVLERLIKKSYGVASRSPEPESLQDANGSCHTLLFRIKPKDK